MVCTYNLLACEYMLTMVSIYFKMFDDGSILYGKQKQHRCKKVAWPSKTVTKRTDMRLWPRFSYTVVTVYSEISS